MGEAVQVPVDHLDVRAVRHRLERSVAALGEMLRDGQFDVRADSCGFEVELDLVDSLGRPRLVNPAVLRSLARRDVQAELSQFNLELNLDPRPLHGDVLRRLDEELTGALAAVSAVAQAVGATAMAVGTLPTLHAEDLTVEHLSENPRYALLDSALARARRGVVHLDIMGPERLTMTTSSIAVQAAATSLQVHLQVTPDDFARFYNAAQAVSPVLVAVSGNARFLLGHRLWHETRIPLIEQSLDIRTRAERASPALHPPRVWFGDRWVASPLDVLGDNVRRMPPLLPLVETADPLDELHSGQVPSLHDLRLHNGTVWRWNRPVYDVQHDHPHLRIENRVIPSGPTGTDMAANSAFYLGLVRAVADRARPLSDVLDFDGVAADLRAAARYGLAALLWWVDGNRPVRRPADRLVLDTLLPLAAEGLRAWRVDEADVSRYLGVVADRVAGRATGSEWQDRTVARLEAQGVPREAALRETVRRYVAQARTGAPVHTWD